MKQMQFENRRVLVRVDFNVPLDQDGKITDDTRMKRALPTIEHLLKNGASVILMSHLGRPLSKLKEDGSINVEAFSLANIKNHLADLLKVKLYFAEDCGGPISQEKANLLQPGEVLLLENTRFYKGEKEGDESFAKGLAALADIYINDAFGAAHRAHASTTTVADFFDEDHKGFGFLMENELSHGEKVLQSPQRPFVAIVGGAKVSDKIPLIQNLLDTTTDICIGGGMAYTFLKARNYQIGNSLFESEQLELSKSILEKAEEKKCKIHLPLDSTISQSFSADAETRMTTDPNIPEGWMGLDIGQKTIEYFSQIIQSAKTIIWNGPMGVFEFESCNKGTFSVANAVAQATQNGAFSLIGGGDSVSAINQSGLSEQVSFISTGGGAMLELLEGKTLPGVKAIKG